MRIILWNGARMQRPRQPAYEVNQGIMPMQSARRSFFFLPLALIATPALSYGLDRRFLASEPYRKTKQRVNLSSITDERDLAVIRDAINPLMRFIVGISFAELPPAVRDMLMTEHGRTVLRRPPLRNEKKRYSIAEMSDWKVCDETQVSFNAIFSDILKKNVWKETFSFVKSPAGWQFHDHAAAHCGDLLR